MHQILLQVKEALSKTAVAVGAPTAGGTVGIVSFFEQITPPLTVLSLIIGIVLGILSYRLKLQKDKRERDEQERRSQTTQKRAS